MELPTRSRLRQIRGRAGEPRQIHARLTETNVWSAAAKEARWSCSLLAPAWLSEGPLHASHAVTTHFTYAGGEHFRYRPIFF